MYKPKPFSNKIRHAELDGRSVVYITLARTNTETIIDSEDYQRIGRYRWVLQRPKDGRVYYAVAAAPNLKVIRLHRVETGWLDANGS